MRKRNQVPDLFTPDGFVAGQMIVHALQASTARRRRDDLGARGVEFARSEGQQTIRAEDHALLQPMFQVKLTQTNGEGRPRRARNGVPGEDAAPPEANAPLARPRLARKGIVCTRLRSSRTRASGSTSAARRIVADVSLEVAPGRARRRHRAERRRQDHALQPALGARAADRGHGSCSTAATSPDMPPYRRARPGSGARSRSRASSRCSPSRERAARRGGALGGTSRLWRRAARVREALERAGWALERVGLAGRTARCRPGSLSHGDKRKLEIAMLLAAEPRVILLDEPMAGRLGRGRRRGSSR